MRLCIIGLPKTGTTGLYKLLQYNMKRHLDDVLCLFEPGTAKPWESFFSCAKAHVSLLTKVMTNQRYLSSPAITGFDKRLMMVRDPRDQVISELLFRPLGRRQEDRQAVGKFISAIDAKVRDPASMSVLGLSAYADRLGIDHSAWPGLAKLMDLQTGAVHDHGFIPIYYEHFVANDFRRLEGIVHLPLQAAGVTPRWLEHIPRSRGTGEWRHWFLPEDVDFFRPLFREYMGFCGYADDWELEPRPMIAPETASDFIRSKFELRNTHFEMYSNRGTPRSADHAALVEERVHDGKDLFQFGNYLLERAPGSREERERAFAWFEIGAVFGQEDCRRSVMRLLRDGLRPRKTLSRIVDDELNRLDAPST